MQHFTQRNTKGNTIVYCFSADVVIDNFSAIKQKKGQKKQESRGRRVCFVNLYCYNKVTNMQKFLQFY